MKYLAILKDSVREAVDTKVLYFTVGLSLLVILVVASVSFVPEPAEKGMQSILSSFPGGRAGFGMPRAPIQYELTDFRQLNDSRPWKGEYQFDLTVRDQEPNAFRLFVWGSSLRADESGLDQEDQEARKRVMAIMRDARNVPPEKLEAFLNERMREEVSRITPERMTRFLREQMTTHGSLEATEVELTESNAGRDYRFRVTCRAKDEAYRSWPHTLTFFFGAVPTTFQTAVGPMVYAVEDTLVGGVGAGVTMLLATVITAFFIPNMLRKGTIDLLLSKPIHRVPLLIYKYIGGLTFMFINTVIVVVGVWLVLGLRSGLWSTGFLLSIFVLTFEFAIFYAVSTLFGVLTRSAIVSILTACLSWVVLWSAGIGYAVVDSTRELKPWPDWLYSTADVIHFVLPRYKDLDILSSKLVARDLLAPDSAELKMLDKSFSSIKWGESIGFTVGFIGIMLGLACWRFAVKDY